MNAVILLMQEMQKIVQQNIRRYEFPEWILPEPSGFMISKNYYESKAFPLVAKLKDAIKKMATHFWVIEGKIKSLTEAVNWYKDKVCKLVEELLEKDRQIERLQEKADDLKRVNQFIGANQVDKIIEIELQRKCFELSETKKDRYR
ncbi:MAG: hypothetical protein ACYDEX_01135 [Mobilitalea sp.]